PLWEAISIGAPKPGSEPEAPEFQDDWYGYVSKDLRDLLAANGAAGQPLGAYSRIYCGNGSLEACRSALQASLSEALAVTPAQIYGHGACAEDPQPSCFDMNRWTEASAVTVPPFPFQNRPTLPAGRRTDDRAAAVAPRITGPRAARSRPISRRAPRAGRWVVLRLEAVQARRRRGKVPRCQASLMVLINYRRNDSCPRSKTLP